MILYISSVGLVSDRPSLALMAISILSGKTFGVTRSEVQFKSTCGRNADLSRDRNRVKQF